MNIGKLVKELASTQDLEARKNASIVIKHIYASYGKIANKEVFRDAIKNCDEHTHLLLDLLIEAQLFSYQ
jgi:1-aminocyclopropane-1-carboxylate deaminase/D-cysteine desulfhydrase-like pyridoxal-dependent ACC family enzyme